MSGTLPPLSLHVSMALVGTTSPSTGWTVWGSNPGGTRYSAPVPTGPGAHQSSYTMGTGYFPGVKRSGRGVDHPHHLAPR